MVGIVRLGEPLAAALLLVLLVRYPLSTALTAWANLAQIGEFSFILAGPGMTLGVLPASGHTPILAGALVSIALNALLFAAIEPPLRWARARTIGLSADPLAELPMATDESCLRNYVVNAGYGRVRRAIVMALKANVVTFLLVEQDRAQVERLPDRGQSAVLGNAVEPAALIQAHVVQARMPVVATPQTLEVRQIVASARTLDPKVLVVVRSHSAEAATLLEGEAAGKVFVGEGEPARAMTGDAQAHVRTDAGPAA